MARPSKYTPELVSQIAGYISDGLTIRDACFGVGISEDTFWRWNREKLEFAEAIKEATNKQKWSSEALMRTSEYRRYTRKARIHSKTTRLSQKHNHTHLASEKLSDKPFGVSQSRSNSLVSNRLSLPKRNGPMTDIFGNLVITPPYLNQSNGRVEWVEKELYGRCVLHRCDLEIWLKQMSD